MYHKNKPAANTFVFRHFNRKGYALFAALGREVKVGVLTVATLATAAPCLASSAIAARWTAPTDEETTQTLDDEQLLDEVVTTATRTPLAADQAARQLFTLTASQLATAGVTSVNDALKLVAGIDVRQRGSFGMQTDISINGGTFDQITIMVNGIAINNPQTGHNAADFPLNLADIERIEVLEGAASRVLGTQAFSGAINIVTRTADKGISLRAAAGSYGTVQTEARGAWTKALRSGGQLSTSVSGSYQRSDGAVLNSDFKGGKMFASLRYDAADFRLDAQLGATANDFGANTFYSAAYPNQWEGTRRYFAAVKGETKGRIRLAPYAAWIRSYDHFQLIRGTHTAENFHRGDVYTLGFNAWTQWVLGRTSVGAELREEGVNSTNLGYATDSTMWVTIAGKTPVYENGKWQHKDGGAAYYQRRVNRTNVSYFLEHNVVLDHWTASVGVMAQRNTMFDQSVRFYPGIDLAYRPSRDLRVFASWNKSLRLPTFTDYFYNTPTHKGDDRLRPEENSAFRLGVHYRPVAGWTVDASGFYQHGTNMIDWVKETATSAKYQAVNWLNLDNYGVSIGTTLDGQQLLGKRQPLQRLRVDYAYVTQSKEDTRTIFKSAYALEYLRHKLVVTLDHRIVSRLGASWALRVQDRNGEYEVFDPATRKSTGVVAPYGTHARLDVKLHWTAPRYSVFVDLHNLTDHRYFDLGNVEQPGRFVMAGASYRF